MCSGSVAYGARMPMPCVAPLNMFRCSQLICSCFQRWLHWTFVYNEHNKQRSAPQLMPRPPPTQDRHPHRTGHDIMYRDYNPHCRILRSMIAICRGLAPSIHPHASIPIFRFRCCRFFLDKGQKMFANVKVSGVRFSCLAHVLPSPYLAAPPLLLYLRHLHQWPLPTTLLCGVSMLQLGRDTANGGKSSSMRRWLG